MHNVYKTLMYITAAFVIMLSVPFFVLYGVGYTTAAANKVVIDFLADNPVSQFFIRKTQETQPVEKEEEP